MLILQPLVVKLTNKWGFGFSAFNELLSLSVLTAFVIRIMLRKKISGFILVFLLYICYMIVLVLYRDLLPLGMVQILIYAQFFFYFYYFHSLDHQTKTDAIIGFKKIMNIFILLIATIAVVELVDFQSYRQLLGVHSVNRGINGFYLISFFGSGPSLGIFISLYVLIWHYYHYALKQPIRKIDLFLLLMAIILGIFSFSRKEVLFIFLFLIFFPYPSRSRMDKWLKRSIFAVGILAGLLVYYFSFFESANRKGFDANYVRWKIVMKSSEILSDYGPWGTGPGTFGSRISLLNDDIYVKYEVGQEMLGWKATNSKGPIYDAFLFTLTTEIGIGILILLFFFVKIYRSGPVITNTYGRFSKNFLIIYTLLLSLLVPMLTNSFGFIIMILLGCMVGPVYMFRTKPGLNNSNT